MIQNWVVDSAAEMEAARMMTLHAAWKVDEVGGKGARNEIKYRGPKEMYNVLDRAIQVHGSLGFSPTCPRGDVPTPAPRGSTAGPTRSTGKSVARRILRDYEPTDVPTE